MNEAFWFQWATNEARRQWVIYSDRSTPTPDVEGVDALDSKGVFRVRFVNGDVMEVAPSAIARPVARPD